MAEERQVDYAAIKARLKSLVPKTRLSTRDAHLAALRDDLVEAHNRGVSFNTLSAELKSAGITISPAALSKYLSRRSPTKRSTTAAKGDPLLKPHGQVKTGTKEPEHLESKTGPK
jgi:hypothetical protein